MTYLYYSVLFLLFFALNTYFAFDCKGKPYGFSIAMDIATRWFCGISAAHCFIAHLILLKFNNQYIDYLDLVIIAIAFLYSLLKCFIFRPVTNMAIKQYQSGLWNGERKYFFGKWYRVKDHVLEVADTCFFGVPIAVGVPDLGDFHRVLFSTGYPFERYENITANSKKGFNVEYSIINKRNMSAEDYFFLCAPENGGIFVTNLDEKNNFDTIYRYERGKLKNTIKVSELAFFDNDKYASADALCDPKFIDWDFDFQSDDGYKCFIPVGRFLFIYDEYEGLLDVFDCGTNTVIYSNKDVDELNIHKGDNPFRHISFSVYFKNSSSEFFDTDKPAMAK